MLWKHYPKQELSLRVAGAHSRAWFQLEIDGRGCREGSREEQTHEANHKG